MLVGGHQSIQTILPHCDINIRRLLAALPIYSHQHAVNENVNTEGGRAESTTHLWLCGRSRNTDSKRADLCATQRHTKPRARSHRHLPPTPPTAPCTLPPDKLVCRARQRSGWLRLHNRSIVAGRSGVDGCTLDLSVGKAFRFPEGHPLRFLSASLQAHAHTHTHV